MSRKTHDAARDGVEREARSEPPSSTGGRTETLREALKTIAAPHDCGCSPCVGQCRSQEALQITVDYMRDIARAALSSDTGGRTEEDIQRVATALRDEYLKGNYLDWRNMARAALLSLGEGGGSPR